MHKNHGERGSPMLNPPHLGELVRENMEEVGWNVTETAQHLNCETRDAFAPAERQGGHVREHGAGVGRYWLGHCRALDADAGKL